MHFTWPGKPSKTAHWRPCFWHSNRSQRLSSGTQSAGERPKSKNSSTHTTAELGLLGSTYGHPALLHAYAPPISCRDCSSLMRMASSSDTPQEVRKLNAAATNPESTRIRLAIGPTNLAHPDTACTLADANSAAHWTDALENARRTSQPADFRLVNGPWPPPSHTR